MNIIFSIAAIFTTITVEGIFIILHEQKEKEVDYKSDETRLFTLKEPESLAFKCEDEWLSVSFMSQSAGIRKRLFFKPRTLVRGETLSRTFMTLKTDEIFINKHHYSNSYRQYYTCVGGYDE